jgi:uncharacterized protein (TIGR02391 family)
MAFDPATFKRLFWSSLMLIGNICTRQQFKAKGVDNLFITHGADEGWRIKAGFPDMNASDAMRQVNNWMQGIHKYHPERSLPIALDVLVSLADSGSIVTHQDRQTAAHLAAKIAEFLQPPSQTPAARKGQQHQRVVDVASSYYASGHYGSAVHRAYEALIAAVKDKAGRPDLEGRDLMFQAFSEKTPILRISDDPAIQEGYKFLFAGAIGAIRNPHAHTSEESLSEEEAIEMLAVCSHLFRVLDSSARVQAS